MRARLATGLLLALALAGCTAPPDAPAFPAEPGEAPPVPDEPREPVRRARPLVTDLMPDLEGLGGHGRDAASDPDEATHEPGPAPPGPTPPGQPAPGPATTPTDPASDPTRAPAQDGAGSNATTNATNGTAPGEAFRVRFRPGEDAQGAPWVTGFQVSREGGSFSASLRGVAGARVHVGSLVLLANDDPAPRHVLLAADPVRLAGVLEARLDFRAADGARLGTLNLSSPSPEASFALPAGGVATGAWTLTLAEGAGSEAAFRRDVHLVVTG